MPRVILLPVFGLVAGFLLRRRLALAVTALAAAVGFAVVALATDEISGWGDSFVWGDTLLALAATLLGIWLGRRFASRGRASA